MLRPQHTRALMSAVGFITFDPASDMPESKVTNAIKAATIMASAPAMAEWIPFSHRELHMLWVALESGAEAILQPSSGMRPDQRRAFRSVANRIGAAVGSRLKF
jgi:hypothetical protein